MNIWVKFLDKVINGKVKRELMSIGCCLIVGQMGTGKSTLFVPIAQKYTEMGFRVFCNFPMKNCFEIPVKEQLDKKSGKYITIIDKDWLYDHDLSDSVVLIDEASPVWGSRDFSTWSQRDTQWFTELRKNNTFVFMITQYYDLIDLNCKRACDCQIFLTRSTWFKNISFCDFSKLASLPVQDKNEIVGIKGCKGFVHEKYDICACHYAVRRLYRRPFYDYFDTTFTFKKKEPIVENELIAWNDILNFEKLKNDSA